MKYLVILALLVIGCGDNQTIETPPDSEVSGYSPDSGLTLAPLQDGAVSSLDAISALQYQCLRVYQAHLDLVARCPNSLHGSVTDCHNVTGTLRANNVGACVTWHETSMCTPPGILMWDDVCTDIFTVGD